MKKDIAIKIQGVSKTYKLYGKPLDRLKEALHPLKKKYHKDFYALNNINFEIKKGETVGIIGKNGSGKSTLLKIITGVTSPNSGHVTVNGKISAILELGAGFNPQMSGIENIYLNNSISGFSKAETDKRIQDIIDFAELGDFIHQPVKTYSSGMKARLAFAVSINVEPDILIVDEALSVGDAAFQRKCFAKMEEIRAKGATILFVSHSENSIVNLCNRAIWISNGNQIIDGTPKLVTGLYMKHVNDDKIDRAQIEKEFESLKASVEDEKNKKQEKVSKPLTTIDNKAPTHCIEEFYDPALKPKSTIYYEEKGAKISDVKITTLDGREVNVLAQDECYKILINLNVIVEIKNLRIGLKIKDIQGVSISGCAFEQNKHSNNIEFNKGSYKIDFIFQAIIIGDGFLLDIVALDLSGKSQMLHRINDAYIFKVKNKNALNIEQGKTSLFKECVINEC